MDNYIIKISNLTKAYKNSVLANNHISLNIKKGEILGILGPNGAGKTTFVRQIAGLIKPTEGDIFIENHNIIKNPNIVPNYISYYGQTLYILDSHRAWETIYYTGIYRGLSKNDSLKQTNMLLDLFNLSDSRNILMNKLSGGQKKIIGIISTIIGFRPIMILDEPTNDLDPENRRKVWDIITYLNNEFEITILLVTHNVMEAEQVIGNVAIIDSGIIIGYDTPAALKSKINNKVRMGLYLNENYKNYDMNSCVNSISNNIDFTEIKAGVWRFLTDKVNASDIFNLISNKIGFDKVDDFRVLTTTLEDVYLTLGGSKYGIK